jgi:RimJ/RimL family protein N-acetyltransferase
MQRSCRQGERRIHLQGRLQWAVSLVADDEDTNFRHRSHGASRRVARPRDNGHRVGIGCVGRWCFCGRCRVGSDGVRDAEGGAVTFTVPSPAVEGHNVVLKPIDPSDLDAMYQLETSPYLQEHWWRGEQLTFEQWVARLYPSTLVQYVVCDKRRHRDLIGRVVAYNANPLDQWAYFGLMRYQEGGIALKMSQGLWLFLDLLFQTWGFYKLYMEVTDKNLTQFESVGKYFRFEGYKKDHWVQRDGSRIGDSLYALYRSTWETEMQKFVRWSLNGRR